MKRIIHSLFFCGVLTVALVGCKGSDGDPGPAGPAGPQGPAAPGGNVSISSTTATLSDWNYDGASASYKATIASPNITQAIADSGMVLVYMVNNGQTKALPVTIYPNATFSQTLTYAYSVGQVEIEVQDSDLTQPNNPGSMSFKVVTAASGMRLANPYLNFGNYEDVKSTFNLQD